MRTQPSGHRTLRSMIRHSAIILFCGLAALGFMRCADPVGPLPPRAQDLIPRLVHTGAADYAVSAIPFAYDPTPAATHPSLQSDDATTGLLPIGFDFEFFGTRYSSINIATNGIVGFDASMGDGCCSAEPIPADDAGYAANNMIAVLWHDLTPDGAGQITYGTSGTAPNRRFVVHYRNVAFWRTQDDLRVDVQLKLFEGSNAIEIHSLVVPADGNAHTQGIENTTGTDAYFVPGRVAESFELSNDAVRFTPPSDKTPPVVAPVVTGTAGDNGWFTSNVGLSWSVTDPESPISATSGCGTVSVTADRQPTTYTCSATSGGGTTTESATIARDGTDPLVGFSGNAGAYTVDQSVLITCAASDATSGLASSDCVDVTGDAYTFGLGASSFTASATDMAGNSASTSISFAVTVDAGSLCNLVKRWVSQKGVANSLCQRLEGGAYDAFRNQIRAQSGKQVPADKAAILIELSNGL